MQHVTDHRDGGDDETAEHETDGKLREHCKDLSL
jgi:hypothetical protein